MNRKVAIVTGAATGLGRETSIALLKGGFSVCINYRTSREPAHAIASEFGEMALAVQADVADYGSVLRMVDQVYEFWGRLDVVINNAGITRDSLLVRQSEEDWDSVLAVNLKGAFNLTKACAPLMRYGGHIINISSYSGLKGKKGQAAYSASKAALLGLTKTAALELAEYNIKVNAILPGYMPTGMGSAAGVSLDQAKKESILHTLSDPVEVAAFISYLISTGNITGQTFVLDSRPV